MRRHFLKSSEIIANIRPRLKSYEIIALDKTIDSHPRNKRQATRLVRLNSGNATEDSEM